MTPTIQYSATFDKATPAMLYDLFADSAKHTAATGMPAKISRKVGGTWTAFGKMLLGKNLVLIPNRMIVQTWRSSEWKKSDPDSILVVSFEKVAGGAKADLVHVGVPEYDHEGVTQGWIKYYWEPWKAYLSSKGAKKRS
ncbi:MAG TPA: SRPBCC domain-containing protein [Candidatus Acidoferrales bacterium]|nr:SRPBCC domain-containing protein [Candidatus Acidoferrales bacterium]